MADYTAAQKSISAAFDSDIEVVTPELEKIQVTSSGKLQLARPDKLRVSRTGGYADVQLVYDGKTVSVYGNNAKAYAQVDLAGTVDQLVDLIQAKSGAAMPGTDLLLTNAYDELMSNVIQAHHIGQGVVDGVARRTTRRAVAVGAAAGTGAAYYGSSCVQVVDAYGRVTTRC